MASCPKHAAGRVAGKRLHGWADLPIQRGSVFANLSAIALAEVEAPADAVGRSLALY